MTNAMTHKLTCLIIDDEPPAVSVLADYVQSIAALELVGTCTNAIQALECLRKQPIDLLFLDIQLPQIRGTDFVRTLQQRPRVIFTTAYREYAVEGFELNAVDYLIKPISFERFLTAVNRVLEAAPEGPADGKAAGGTDRCIHVRIDRKTQKIPLAEILYIESLKDYSRIVTASKKWVTKQPLSLIEGLLPGEAFIRVHRSFIVSVDKIRSYTHEIIEVDGQELPIGRNYKTSVEKVLRT
jgi:DNA-binding LytR/AlgR family response regulator